MTDRTYLDCCTLLNIYATGALADVLHANRLTPTHTFAIADAVSHECQFIRSADGVGREPVDLQPYVVARVITTDQLETPEESTTAVALGAAGLDDGEAATAALAIHRSARIASDDAAAIGILRQSRPSLEVIRTSQLLKSWGERTNASPASLRETLTAIKIRARFIPPRADPLFSWWISAAA